MVTLHHRQPAHNPRNVSVSVQLQHLHQPQSHGLALRYAGSRHSLAVVAAAAAAGGAGSPDGRLPIKQQLLGFIQAHYLPLALLTALLLGATFPGLGVAAAGLQIPTFTTFGIFVVQVGSGSCCLMSAEQIDCAQQLGSVTWVKTQQLGPPSTPSCPLLVLLLPSCYRVCNCEGRRLPQHCQLEVTDDTVVYFKLQQQ